VVEYVLDEPRSYVLAITGTSARRYILPGKNLIERQTTKYREVIRKQKEDLKLARLLFDELLGGIPEYKDTSTLIVVPDGQLHLLPFVALADSSGYVVASHAFCAVESGTVLKILRSRHAEARLEKQALPYVGVAAWTKATDDRNIMTKLFNLRAVSGPQRSQLIALPESRREVEEIGKDLPKPSTLLLGAGATESHFKELPLADFKVLHLALHGYADIDYPERSALVFAPEEGNSDDGLLQLPEIRHLHLNASLVTLSACNTGVGPVGESGVSNVAGAFVEAGAESVVSTLWELEDHSTSRLMQAFYGHLAKHEEKADALRAAQMSLAGTGFPPYYWASFELVGNPSGTIVNDSQLLSKQGIH
jgi:CHAT domain-containing protein